VSKMIRVRFGLWASFNLDLLAADDRPASDCPTVRKASDSPCQPLESENLAEGNSAKLVGPDRSTPDGNGEVR